MCFLVLHGAGGRSAADGEPHGQRLVAQYSAVVVAGYGLVVKARHAVL